MWRGILHCSLFITIKSEEAKLAIGSDRHGAHYETNFEKAFIMLDRVGIKDAGLWRLAPGHKPKGLSS